MGKPKTEIYITEDQKIFGDTLVYCSQHRRVHSTGWCTVGVSDKVGLGIPGGIAGTEDDVKKGVEKAKRFGLIK